MTNREDPPRRSARRPKPLDATRVDELALAYVARFATSAARLERYLRRKLRERGWEGDAEPDLAAIVTRYVDLGYVDDAALRDEVRPGEGAERRAALTLARKRGFGPFGTEPPDRARREKQIAAMLRAGHSLDSAREMVDAESEAAAEQWAAECDEEEL